MNKTIKYYLWGLLILLFLFLPGKTLFAQMQRVSYHEPLKGERGASFRHTIWVEHETTATANNDSRVTFLDSRIKWQRITEGVDFPSYSYHIGRIVIPADVPAGSYRYILYNSYFDGGQVSSYYTIEEFEVNIGLASPNTLVAGADNQSVVFTFSPALPNYSTYEILQVTSQNTGVTVKSAQFLSSTTIQTVLDVDANAVLGNIGLYVTYGIKAENRKLKSHSPIRKLTLTPSESGDYNTISLDSQQSILVVGENAPIISSSQPSSVARGVTNKKLRLYGSGFKEGLSLTTNHQGVSFSSTLMLSELEAITYVTTTGDAVLGDVAIIAWNDPAIQKTSTGVLRVTATKPGFISINPNSLTMNGTTQRVCITGSNFTTDTYVIFESNYIQVINTEFISSTQICIDLLVLEGGTSGPVDLQIYNPGGIYTEVDNALYLTFLYSGDRTLYLLYPGVEGGSPNATDETMLRSEELISTQFPIFRWFSRAQKFRISIYKPLAGQTSPLEIINNRPLHQVYVYNENYYQYPLSARELKPGIRYYWVIEAYFNTLEESSSSNGGEVGEVIKSEIWSFVLRNTSDITEETKTTFGSINPVYDIILEPNYLEITPGDRVSLILRAIDRYGNNTAFIPNLDYISLKNVEENYPDLMLLPKSFGRVELMVPQVFSTKDLQEKLLKNPLEFSRLPVLLYISKDAKGVGALLVQWQDKKYYSLINVLPPKKAMLESGEIDRFNIGIASRQSESFAILLNEPVKAGTVINTDGKLIIDSAGFRDKGYLPVSVKNVRVDQTGRAYTGAILFSGNEHMNLAGYELLIKEILIPANAPSVIKGDLKITGNNSVAFEGYLSGLGELRGKAEVKSDISLPHAVIPEKSKIELDFSSYWSPEYKKYDPSFRGIILSYVKDNEEDSRRAALASPEYLSTLGTGVKSDTINTAKLNLNLSKYTLNPQTNNQSILASAERDENGLITVKWICKQDDIIKFNVYRRSSGESQYRLVAERINKTEFTDLINSSNYGYWYKISGLSDKMIEITKSNIIQINNTKTP